MENEVTEEAWAVWSPNFGDISRWSISERNFLREMNITNAPDWEDFYQKGYRIIPIKITYQRPE